MKLENILIYCSWAQSAKDSHIKCHTPATIAVGPFRYPYCNKHSSRTISTQYPIFYLFPFSDRPKVW